VGLGGCPPNVLASNHWLAPCWCPGPESNRHDAFRRRRILSPLCLPVSPPGQGDHCNGGEWFTDEVKIGRTPMYVQATPPVRNPGSCSGPQPAPGCARGAAAPEFWQLSVSLTGVQRCVGAAGHSSRHPGLNALPRSCSAFQRRREDRCRSGARRGSRPRVAEASRRVPAIDDRSPSCGCVAERIPPRKK
jgi:hypothetical protein